MDKKHIKDKIILVSKIYIAMFALIMIPVNLIVSIIGGIFNGNVLELVVSNTIGVIAAFVSLGIITYSIIGLVYLFSIINRKFSILSFEQYTRELPEYFPPAIASLLLDLSVETTTDYTATIAYLISKKRIKLSDKSDDIEVISDNQAFASRHESYVFQCVTKQTKFDATEFRRLVVYDAKNMKLVESGKRKIHFWRNIAIAIAIYFVCGIIANISKNSILEMILYFIGFIAGISIFATIGYSIYLLKKNEVESIYRTKMGEAEARKWSGLKKYFKQYTLISDRNLSDILIFDDYIPYAISMNEAKTIEKFIENNDKYRKLIYGNIDL